MVYCTWGEQVNHNTTDAVDDHDEDLKNPKIELNIFKLRNLVHVAMNIILRKFDLSSPTSKSQNENNGTKNMYIILYILVKQ